MYCVRLAERAREAETLGAVATVRAGRAGVAVIAGTDCTVAGEAGTFQVNTYLVSPDGALHAGDAPFSLVVP